MKFDLEISVSDVLTQAGKDKLANIFFPVATSSLTGRFNSTMATTSVPIDTSRFRLIDYSKWNNNIDPSYFNSRIMNTGELTLAKSIIKRGSIIPFFNTGTVIFHKYPVAFSNDTVRLLLDYDGEFNRYSIKIPTDTNTSSIRIITSKLSSGGIADVYQDFQYISESNVPVMYTTDISSAKYKLGSIIVSTDITGGYTGLYTTSYSMVPNKIVDGSGIKIGVWNTVKSSMNDGNAYINKDDNIIIIKDNGIFSNLIHTYLFTKSRIDNLFTISTLSNGDKYIYLNTKKINFSQQINKTIAAGKSTTEFFNQYPVENIENNFITNYPVTGWNVKILKNLIKFTNTTSNPVVVSTSLSGQLYPIITYSRGTIDTAKNIRHMKIDVSPRSVNFGDGALCFVNNEVNKSNIAETIIIDNGDNEIRPFVGKPITVKILNSEGVPLPNKNVKLTLDDDINGSVQWGIPADETNSISGITNLSGEFTTTIINSNIKDTCFVQKQWVGTVSSVAASGFNIQTGTFNKMYLPQDLTGVTSDNVFTFIITADDPVLGQIRDKGGLFGITKEFFTSSSCFDYYMTEDINTYELSGRRIAYAEITADQQIGATSKYTIKSSYIKPTSITVVNTQKEFYGKKLFLYNPSIGNSTNNALLFPNILTTVHTSFTKVAASDFTIRSIVTSAFNDKWLLTDNTFDYFRFTVPKYTEITFNSQLPGENDNNVIGYLIRVKRSGMNAKITAEHSDTFLDTILSTSSTGMEIVASPENDSTFTLSTESNTINSYIGPYSHLTLSDYMSSQYGTNYATYVCKYSQGNIVDGVTNRCNHPNNITRMHYLGGPEGANLYCRHNVALDATLDEWFGVGSRSAYKCPGLDQQLINPFLLYTN
jgi:hypothetical protein